MKLQNADLSSLIWMFRVTVEGRFSVISIQHSERSHQKINHICHNDAQITREKRKTNRFLRVRRSAGIIVGKARGFAMTTRMEKRTEVSEESRQQPAWMMPPSCLPSSSTPIKTTDADIILSLKDIHRPAMFNPARQHQCAISPCSGSLRVLPDISQDEFDDTEILQLQDRANRLLLRDECTPSDGSMLVSSEGLGCSDFSPGVNIDEQVPRTLISDLIKSTAGEASSNAVQVASTQKSSIMIPLVPPTRPEEDILFQWRLRRKIEKANEWPQSLQHSRHHVPTFNWQLPSVSHPSDSGQVYKTTQPLELSQKAPHPHIDVPQPEIREAQAPCPPTSEPPPLPTFIVPHVPAHMHYLCDILPCGTPSSHTSTQQNITENISESSKKVANKKIQVSRNSLSTLIDEPVQEPVLCTPRAEDIEEERPSHHHPISETKEKVSENKTVKSLRQRKKSRCAGGRKKAVVSGSTSDGSSHQCIPKNVKARAEQQKGSQESSYGIYTDGYISPVHSALGQVVSEVLFPTLDSSCAQRTLLPCVPCAPPAPLQSTVPPHDAQNSMVVISQLLQEAEDSEEKEFEDDPLLQVLRKQRTWVKEQISEVDSVLNELLNQQPVTCTLIKGT